MSIQFDPLHRNLHSNKLSLSDALPHGRSDKVRPSTDILEYMKSEQHRIDSYDVNSWPTDIATPEELARAGLFSTQVGDRVQCPFCQGTIHHWEPRDIPLVEHRKYFPRCEFVQGIDCGNIPINSAISYTTHSNSIARTSRPSHPCNKVSRQTTTVNVNNGLVPAGYVSHYSSPSHSHAISSNIPNNTSSLENHTTEDSQPVDLTVEANRLVTFTTWPKHLKQQPFLMVQAGFYFYPSQEKPDRVKCAFCLGRMFNWLQTDDPFTEHARNFPTCPYIRRCLGDDVVDEIYRRHQLKNRNTTETSYIEDPGVIYPNVNRSEEHTTVTSRDDDFDRRMLSEPVCAVLAMGFTEDKVKQVVRRCLRQRPGNFPPTEELAEMLIEPELSGQASGSATVASSPASPAQRPSTQRPSTQSLVQRPSSSTQMPQVQRPSALTGKEQFLCKVCMENEIGVTFMPCGHLTCCGTCSNTVTLCPICRTHIEQRVRTYF